MKEDVLKEHLKDVKFGEVSMESELPSLPAIIVRPVSSCALSDTRLKLQTQASIMFDIW